MTAQLTGGVACCLHLALEIAAKHTAMEWREECRKLPRECQDPERRCTGPDGCRKRVAAILAVQYKILESGWQPRAERSAR